MVDRSRHGQDQVVAPCFNDAYTSSATLCPFVSSPLTSRPVSSSETCNHLPITGTDIAADTAVNTPSGPGITHAGEQQYGKNGQQSLRFHRMAFNAFFPASLDTIADSAPTDCNKLLQVVIVGSVTFRAVSSFSPFHAVDRENPDARCRSGLRSAAWPSCRAVVRRRTR